MRHARRHYAWRPPPLARARRLSRPTCVLPAIVSFGPLFKVDSPPPWKPRARLHGLPRRSPFLSRAWPLSQWRQGSCGAAIFWAWCLSPATPPGSFRYGAAARAGAAPGQRAGATLEPKRPRMPLARRCSAFAKQAQPASHSSESAPPPAAAPAACPWCHRLSERRPLGADGPQRHLGSVKPVSSIISP
jgi:hypothetical protein